MNKKHNIIKLAGKDDVMNLASLKMGDVTESNFNLC
jgi:hypothetical protein